MPGKWMDSERVEDRQPAAHFAGCWCLAGHHTCAIAELERLQAAYKDLAANGVTVAMQLEQAQKAAAVWKRAAKRLWARRETR